MGNRNYPLYTSAPYNGAFLFVTDQGTTYLVEVSKDEFRFNGHDLLSNAGLAFEISFERTLDSTVLKEKFDGSICSTIIHIISTNIISKGDQAVFFFVCDTSDGAGQCRARLFNVWFPLLKEQIPDIQKYHFVVPGFDEDHYDIFLLIFNNHINRDAYVEEFEKSMSDNFSKGI